MQFDFNTDYPGTGPDGSAAMMVPPSAPLDFPEAQPTPCARITTRIFHPSRNQVAMVQNVLVRTRPPPRASISSIHHMALAAAALDDDSMSSRSSNSSDDESMTVDIVDALLPNGDNNNSSNNADQDPPEEDRAYWIQRTIRDAIYGRVLFAVVLRKRIPTRAPNDNAEWEVTEHYCAVKELSWQHIRRERGRLAEDPIKEVAAMQHLKQWHEATRKIKEQEQHLLLQQSINNSTIYQSNGPTATTLSSSPYATTDGVIKSFLSILDTNIMMPLDLLSDDTNLYSIMPYCDGGELFERLDLNEKFTEPEARYWMFQVLNGLENMQNAGLCHRDMSLENLLVHESGALIIDMGMCLRIPFFDDDDKSNIPNTTTAANTLSASFQNMNMNGLQQAAIQMQTTPQSAAQQQQQQLLLLQNRRRRRSLITPQGTCGKWIYMSPEIYKNREPFDGYAVDMWAAGVILFLMLTGFPPWERACQTDERFRYMTAGYLVQMLTEWQLGLSDDAMDLLQRMLFLDPKDRLSLDQVRAHPWMVNGPLQPPPPPSIIVDNTLF